MIEPGIPDWGVYGDEMHRGNLMCSIQLSEPDLEIHNIHLNEKYKQIIENEQRADLFHCDDAEIIFIASNTPSRMVKGAIQDLRKRGIKAGLFRPISLWPFPINYFLPVLKKAKRLIVVEASNGQLEAELRLALSLEEIHDFPPIEHVRRFGGVLPQANEIIDKVVAGKEVKA